METDGVGVALGVGVEVELGLCDGVGCGVDSGDSSGEAKSGSA